MVFKQKTAYEIMPSLVGLGDVYKRQNGGLEKFWPNLEISKAFEMGLEVSFSGDFASCSDPVTNSYGESWDSSCEKL